MTRFKKNCKPLPKILIENFKAFINLFWHKQTWQTIKAYKINIEMK